MLSEECLIAMCGQPKSEVLSFKSSHSTCFINALSSCHSIGTQRWTYWKDEQNTRYVSEFSHSQPLMYC